MLHQIDDWIEGASSGVSPKRGRPPDRPEPAFGDEPRRSPTGDRGTTGRSAGDPNRQGVSRKNPGSAAAGVARTGRRSRGPSDRRISAALSSWPGGAPWARLPLLAWLCATAGGFARGQGRVWVRGRASGAGTKGRRAAGLWLGAMPTQDMSPSVPDPRGLRCAPVVGARRGVPDGLVCGHRQHRPRAWPYRRWRGRCMRRSQTCSGSPRGTSSYSRRRCSRPVCSATVMAARRSSSLLPGSLRGGLGGMRVLDVGG